jgi:hypothetical protein
MQRHAVNYLADYPSRVSPRLEALVLQPMPHLRRGTYRVKVNYLIPGVNKVTSSYELELVNRIPDND